jgi:hypothetical protein
MAWKENPRDLKAARSCCRADVIESLPVSWTESLSTIIISESGLVAYALELGGNSNTVLLLPTSFILVL